MCISVFLVGTFAAGLLVWVSLCSRRHSSPLAVAAPPVREASSAPADVFRPCVPGVEYRHDARADGPLSIHVLRISRIGQRWDLRTALGQGTVFGLEPLEGIIARSAAVVKRPAVAAINGDFFVIKAGPYQGDPRGCRSSTGNWSAGRPATRCGWPATGIEVRPRHVETAGRLAGRQDHPPLG